MFDAIAPNILPNIHMLRRIWNYTNKIRYLFQWLFLLLLKWRMLDLNLE